MDLATKHCVPCEDKNFPPLTRPQAEDLMAQVPGWRLNDTATELSRDFAFQDFASAMGFANKIGKLADQEWHHPDLAISWGKVGIRLATHSIKGLSENDFIMAAKINLL